MKDAREAAFRNPLYTRYSGRKVVLSKDFHRKAGGYKQGENGGLKRGRGHITGAQFFT
ncbi:MAG: hypothetical protein LUO97_00850 [Methanomicrobiales archaeon]|nr:hypothetical protein [Methanomicrobiales archaeon]